MGTANLENRPWIEQAACAGCDPDLFFPSRGGDSKPAKEVCQGCPVRQECLDHAIDHQQWMGVLGGMVPRERKQYAQRRKVSAAPFTIEEWDELKTGRVVMGVYGSEPL